MFLVIFVSLPHVSSLFLCVYLVFLVWVVIPPHVSSQIGEFTSDFTRNMRRNHQLAKKHEVNAQIRLET